MVLYGLQVPLKQSALRRLPTRLVHTFEDVMRLRSLSIGLLVVVAWAIYGVRSCSPSPSPANAPRAIPAVLPLVDIDSKVEPVEPVELARTRVAESPPLRVLVLSGGLPVAGAHLFLCRNLSRSRFPIADSLGESGSDGWIDVPADVRGEATEAGCHLVVARIGLSSGLVGSPDTAGRATVTLNPLATIRVRCLDAADDSPIPGATVVVSRNSIGDAPVSVDDLPGLEAEWRVVAAITDATGLAAIGGVDQGRHLYRVFAPDGFYMVEGPVRLTAGRSEVVCRFERAYGIAFAASEATWLSTDIRLTGSRTGGQRLARLVELRRAAAARYGESGDHVFVLGFAGKAGVPEARLVAVDSAGRRFDAVARLAPLEDGLPVVERVGPASMVGQVPLTKVVLSFFGPEGKPADIGDLTLEAVSGGWCQAITAARPVHELLAPPGGYRLKSSRHALGMVLPQARHAPIEVFGGEAQSFRVDLLDVPTRVSWALELPSSDSARLLALEVQDEVGRSVSVSAVPATGHDWLPRGAYKLRFRAGDAYLEHRVEIAGQQQVLLNGCLTIAEGGLVRGPR